MAISHDEQSGISEWKCIPEWKFRVEVNSSGIFSVELKYGPMGFRNNSMNLQVTYTVSRQEVFKWPRSQADFFGLATSVQAWNAIKISQFC